MAKKVYRLGANENSKRYKKTIKINLNWAHLTLLFFMVCFIVAGLIILATSLGIFTVEEQKLKCSDGTIEYVEFGKEYYCGEHYTKLDGLINEHIYKAMENKIQNGK